MPKVFVDIEWSNLEEDLVDLVIFINLDWQMNNHMHRKYEALSQNTRHNIISCLFLSIACSLQREWWAPVYTHA
jgi:hypothetical protein